MKKKPAKFDLQIDEAEFKRMCEEQDKQAKEVMDRLEQVAPGSVTKGRDLTEKELDEFFNGCPTPKRKAAKLKLI